MTRRIWLIQGLFVFWFLLLCLRLAYWQVIRAADLKAQGEQQTTANLILPSSRGLILASDGEKMSKSRGNVVNPDNVVNEFGGDSLRLYEMFMGPLEKVKPWKADGVKGVYNFLNRAYRFFADPTHLTINNESEETSKILHKTIIQPD